MLNEKGQFFKLQEKSIDEQSVTKAAFHQLNVLSQNKVILGQRLVRVQILEMQIFASFQHPEIF